MTANPHPAVMTIQPLPSAFERFSKTAATTPSPSRIIIIVPRNSPRNGDVIEKDPPSGFNPVERPRHCFFPVPVKFFPLLFLEVRFPDMVDRPIRPQLFQPSK